MGLLMGMLGVETIAQISGEDVVAQHWRFPLKEIFQQPPNLVIVV